MLFPQGDPPGWPSSTTTIALMGYVSCPTDKGRVAGLFHGGSLISARCRAGPRRLRQPTVACLAHDGRSSWKTPSSPPPGPGGVPSQSDLSPSSLYIPPSKVCSQSYISSEDGRCHLKKSKRNGETAADGRLCGRYVLCQRTNYLGPVSCFSLSCSPPMCYCNAGFSVGELPALGI